MTPKIILPQQRRRGENKEDAAAKELLAKTVTEEIEKIARSEAAKNKIDITQKGALLRVMMHVMERKELLEQAGINARRRLEAEGKIPKEDLAIVKHKKITP